MTGGSNDAGDAADAVIGPTAGHGWLIAYLFLWTVIAVVAATTAFIAIGGTSFARWVETFAIMAEFFYAWAVIALFVNWLLRRLPFDARAMVWVVPLHVTVLFAVTALLALVVHGGDWRSWLFGSRAPAFHALNALVYTFVLVASLMLRYYFLGQARQREMQVARMRSIELQAELGRARVDALRLQMNPHFLFNTLNSIAALVESGDKAGAYRMTELLGALLRAALQHGRAGLVSLDTELGVLEKYVEIESIRFADKLRYRQFVPDEYRPCRVPSFLLQPLVENAVRHAVSRSAAPVTIDLSIGGDGRALTIEVCDDGPGLRRDSERGCGLANIAERLALLYGDDACVELGDRGGGGAVARIVLPLVTGSVAPAGAAARRYDEDVSNLGDVPSPPGRIHSSSNGMSIT